MSEEGAIRNISDTAIRAAMYRARETERPGALFRDPFAARRERLPLLLRLIAMLPESSGPQGNRPWSGICLLENNSQSS